MTGRSPARLLAPLALVAAAVALFAVVGSGGRATSTDDSSGADTRPAATAAPSRKSSERKRSRTRTYTVKPGDTPSGIAQKMHVDVDELLQANPDADPGALTVGEKLKLP